MTEYRYTKDWFNWAPEVWTQLIPMLPDRLNFLEIGSFEGRSAAWIVKNMMKDEGNIQCVDTWEGGEEHGAENMSEVEARFLHNVKVLEEKYPDRSVIQIKDTSTRALARFIEKEYTYDFIYIDGSHKAPDVLTDACMAWPLLKRDGLMVFDDYLWGNPRDTLHRPKIAIDAFTNIFGETAEIVHVGYQLVVRKKD
jgi:predicted O-methyltransferase YrrM